MLKSLGLFFKTSLNPEVNIRCDGKSLGLIFTTSLNPEVNIQCYGKSLGLSFKTSLNLEVDIQCDGEPLGMIIITYIKSNKGSIAYSIANSKASIGTNKDCFCPYSLYYLRPHLIGVFCTAQYIIIVAQCILSKGKIWSMYNSPSLVIIWVVYKCIITSFKWSYSHTIIGTVLWVYLQGSRVLLLLL